VLSKEHSRITQENLVLLAEVNRLRTEFALMQTGRLNASLLDSKLRMQQKSEKQRAMSSQGKPST